MSRIPSHVFMEVQVGPCMLEGFANEDGLWYESREDVELKLRASKHKYLLLNVIRELMESCLTARQRQCILLYYFEGKSLREIGTILQLHFTTVQQHLHAGISRLKKALREELPEVSWTGC